MTTTTYYRDLISKTLSISTDEARLVEGFLRSEHGTLDALSVLQIRDAYIDEIKDFIAADRSMARRIADAMGI